MKCKRCKKGNLYFHGLPEDRADRPWKVGCMWVYHSGVNPKKHGAWVPNLWDFDCAITNTNEYCTNCSLIRNNTSRPKIFKCSGHVIE